MKGRINKCILWNGVGSDVYSGLWRGSHHYTWSALNIAPLVVQRDGLVAAHVRIPLNLHVYEGLVECQEMYVLLCAFKLLVVVC